MRWRGRNGYLFVVVVAALLVELAACKKTSNARLKDEVDDGAPHKHRSGADVEDLFAKPLAPPKGDVPDYSDTLLADSSMDPNGIDLGKSMGLMLTEGETPDIDLSDSDTPIRDQGSRPTCTAFAAIAGLENILARSGTVVDLSAEQLWSYYNDRKFLSALNGVRDHWITTEAEWPYGRSGKAENGRFRISDYAAIGFSQVADDLASNRRPVYMAVATNASWRGNSTGIIGIDAPPSTSEHKNHGILVVGIEHSNTAAGGGYFIFKNSWGTRWGDSGYGYLPFAYCQSWYCEAWRLGAAEIAPATQSVQNSPSGREPWSPTNNLPAPASLPVNNGQVTACGCAMENNSCFLTRGQQRIPVGRPQPNCAQNCVNQAAANACKY